MRLYVSTNETTPFYVKIENNKRIIDSVQIRKGSPQTVDINYMMMVTDSVSTVTKKGIHVFSDKKFFANLRFSQSNHAEIVTSKGRAGLGKHFFAGYAPFSIEADPLNYNISVIATEDNTVVNMLDRQIFLNKGESFIVRGFPMDNSYIGKEITSDKPISVTNGNYNGQHTSTNRASDILMDQNVPVERLGKEYILMIGNGSASGGMETAIIIATEDNTEVYFNDQTAPYRTLAKGEYFLFPASFYIYKTADTSSAYIRSSRNILVFQLLSGSGSNASGGFNYIPPLNCYLPKMIDELGFINQNAGASSDGFKETHLTKLNIITQKSPDPANPTKVYLESTSLGRILLNGTYGPYDVTGTNDWVTFAVPNVQGTITVESERAVTAGIAAGSNAVGYGGYFAGASSMPIITKSGDCFPDITLEVDDTFEHYQWQKLNVATGIFEDIPGANSFSLTPDTVGEYKAILGTVTCGLTETPVHKVLNCTINSTWQITDVCNTVTIPLKLTGSSEPLNLSRTRILQNPRNGTVEMVGGTIFYEPNLNYKGGDRDTFSFYIEDSSTYPDSEIVTVEIIFREPKRSNLTNKTICIGKVTTLDAKEGFTKYTWSNGETTRMIQNVTPGDYYVDLEFDGCKYRHFVTVDTFPEVHIRSIGVTGGTVTVTASGGNKEYQYSLDHDQNWQSSNIFTDVSPGIHTMYVKDKIGCKPVTKEFLVINLINVITPNGDGNNDVLDYSVLTRYQHVSVEIYNRYGSNIYRGTDGNYIWDGKINGRTVPTGNYWFVLKWTEPDTGDHKMYHGWILVKNR